MKFKSETSSYCNLQPEIAIHRPEIEPNKLTENIFHLQYHNFIEIIKNITLEKPNKFKFFKIGKHTYQIQVTSI